MFKSRLEILVKVFWRTNLNRRVGIFRFFNQFYKFLFFAFEQILVDFKIWSDVNCSILKHIKHNLVGIEVSAQRLLESKETAVYSLYEQGLHNACQLHRNHVSFLVLLFLVLVQILYSLITIIFKSAFLVTKVFDCFVIQSL